MFLICSGPDTWSAHAKARELEAAFRQKHDPQGLSIQRMDASEFKEILSGLSTPSFFSPKRFIRCTGLLEHLKIADVRAFAKRLQGEQDSLIFVTIEEEPPSAKILSEFEGVKVIRYDHPLLSGGAFLAWCKTRAQALGATIKDAIDIAQRTDGDAWLAEQELMKRAANMNAPLVTLEGETGSVFDVAEAYLRKSAHWRGDIHAVSDSQPLMVIASQSRSAVRVMSGDTSGIHPFVVKKLSQIRRSDISVSFLETLL
jgi:DNA polymerase III delta subunit